MSHLRTQIPLYLAALGLLLWNEPASSQMLDYFTSAVPRTIGSVIPMPKLLQYPSGDDYYQLQPKDFQLSFSSHNQVDECEIVRKAAKRYIAKGYFFDDLRPTNTADHTQLQPGINGKPIKQLKSLLLTGTKTRFECQMMPHEQMDESYELRLDPNQVDEPSLVANTSWGLIKGLETFSQMVYQLDQQAYAIRAVQVVDEPRFKHRGFMLDTARHYIPMERILQILDAMAFNKLNVFHWHIVDDQSFPLVLSSFPDLSRLASFRPKMIYNESDVKLVVDYAAQRGIRVVPELDTPGHTLSMRFIKDFLTQCYDRSSGKPNGKLGPVNPTKMSNYKTMAKIVKNFRSLFPDNYFHAGGDEVNFDCWESNPEIINWMHQHNMDGNSLKLNQYYLGRLYDIVTHFNKTMLVWQEVYDLGVNLPRDAIVQVWKYLDDRPAYQAELDNVVNEGYRAILSSCWYIDHLSYGSDWVNLYRCDPSLSSSMADKSDLLIGGEIAMWTEFVDETNLISRSWPRSSAAAERLWSPSSITNVTDFLYRVEQMRCRLRFRNIQAEPVNGPGYC